MRIGKWSKTTDWSANAIELQTAYVLDNLKKTFEAAGSSLDHVVKAQVFLTDLANFHGFDTVWKRYFKVSRLTRQSMGLSRHSISAQAASWKDMSDLDIDLAVFDLDGILVERPRRQIIRSSPSRNGGSHADRHVDSSVP